MGAGLEDDSIKEDTSKQHLHKRMTMGAAHL